MKLFLKVLNTYGLFLILLAAISFFVSYIGKSNFKKTCKAVFVASHSMVLLFIIGSYVTIAILGIWTR